MATQAFYRPDWIMLGVQHTEGVLVFASNTLGLAELRAEIDQHLRTFGDPFRVPPRPRYSIHAEMRQWVMVGGVDYADAICKLFDSWSPTDTSTPPVDRTDTVDALGHVRALEAGDRRG